MLFIENVQVDMSVINPQNPTGGRRYNGGNEVMAMMANKWQELSDRYGVNEPIRFVRPHLKSGIGEKKQMGISVPRKSRINTSNGTKTIRWCDMTDTDKGTVAYLPAKFLHDPAQPIVLTLQNDIEQILWHCLFDSLRKRKFQYPEVDGSGKPHPKAGEQVSGLFIHDPDSDAAKFLKNNSRSSEVWYFITANTSPISGNRDIINTLASAWGVVKPETYSEAIVKQMLIGAIEAAEVIKDMEFGYDAFISAVKNIVSGDDTERTEMFALVNKSIDRNIIALSKDKTRWDLLSETGVVVKRICTVPASLINKPKDAIVTHLLQNEEDLTYLQGGIESKPLKEKDIKKVWIPKNPTKDFFVQMKHPKMKKICNIINLDSFAKTKEQLIPILIDYFITQGKTIPEQNLLSEPPLDE